MLAQQTQASLTLLKFKKKEEDINGMQKTLNYFGQAFQKSL